MNKISTWDELIETEEYKNIQDPSYLYAYYTDKLSFQTVSEISFENLLELRIFNKEGEIRLFRTNIFENSFYVRYADETNKTEDDYFVQKQYLDIDSTKNESGKVRTTGGGEYPLPIDLNGKKDAYITIYNYVKYYEKTGQAYVYDR